MSVQGKALTAAEFLSPAWLEAARRVSLEFLNAVLGKSAYWYTHGTAFPLVLVPFVIGVIWHVRHRRLAVAPLSLITIVYVGACAGSGSSYAVNFPWYFVPVLPAVYLVCGTGIVWALSAVSGKSPFLQDAYRCFSFRALNLGIRSDMVATLQPHLADFHAIYETIDIDSEHHWDSGSGEPVQATGNSRY